MSQTHKAIRIINTKIRNTLSFMLRDRNEKGILADRKRKDRKEEVAVLKHAVGILFKNRRPK